MTSDVVMPTLYVPHGGGPCFFMEWNPPDFWQSTQDYLECVIDSLPMRPNAILVISAHWVEDEFTVATAASPNMIYDYYGFPPHTYELQYPAPGEPALAGRVIELLGDAGIPAKADPSRGFDHGVFVPLKVMLPQADIPIVTLSLKAGYDPAAHIAAGRALASLRDEGVLILGSGMSFHNMAVMRGAGADATAAAIAFDDWLTAAIKAEPDARNAALSSWPDGDHARTAHPPGGEEHLLPLMIAAGAGDGETGHRDFSSRDLPLPFSAFRFGG